MYKRKYKTSKQRLRAIGCRSGLEEINIAHLKNLGLDSTTIYESLKIRYIIPESKHVYTPDFPLPNGVIVETKGRLTKADREKHLYIKKQMPELDIRFVFSNSRNKIGKGSKTSYADWCIKNGFLYAESLIPIEWIKQKPK
jgi:hypothetical protein